MMLNQLFLFYNLLEKRNNLEGSNVMTTQTKRMTRTEVPEEQTWDLTDLFASREEWEHELKALQANVSDVTQFKGKLVLSAENLLNGMKRSEEHTSELQSRFDLVCRLLLEKINKRE